MVPLEVRRCLLSLAPSPVGVRALRLEWNLSIGEGRTSFQGGGSSPHGLLRFQRRLSLERSTLLHLDRTSLSSRS